MVIELRASHFLDRCSEHLSHFASPPLGIFVENMQSSVVGHGALPESWKVSSFLRRCCHKQQVFLSMCLRGGK
jgi:hypothetical protein